MAANLNEIGNPSNPCYVSGIRQCQDASILCFVTAVITNTRPQRVFSSVQTCVLVDVNQPLPWFFTRWPREDSFSVSWALGRICRRFSRFCNILLQDLTPLHVKITRRKNLLSVSRRKLKLSTYLHTVSYNHISFLNRSQLVWVLASSGFYSITWRMISSKIHFRKQPLFRGEFSPFRCDIASSQFVHGSRVFIQSNK